MTLHIRPATQTDAEVLFAWRNDDLTRRMFVNTEPVAWPDHLCWLAARLARSEPNLYVAEVGGHPVGTIRIDDGGLSYTVAPEHRGNGIATEMLRWVFERFGPLRAEIKPENAASIRAAEKAGHAIVLLHD